MLIIHFHTNMCDTSIFTTLKCFLEATGIMIHDHEAISLFRIRRILPKYYMEMKVDFDTSSSHGRLQQYFDEMTKSCWEPGGLCML